ncbi:hypothetical protein [Kitasatospora sp. GP82]|uniref:hypothetical protein n=1 Tax=Kitasatospora sp. GP82 TaxID=3035089 RepID=UPI002473479C|nr:hypothetical protein [Kitasatospora sp. GP82]MDH6124591.1 hypothetical protein [Kitasatospora sp. GP82]
MAIAEQTTLASEQAERGRASAPEQRICVAGAGRAVDAGGSGGAVDAGGPSTGLHRWTATALALLGLAMVPWVIVLHTGLPATAVASRWAWTWTGLDSLEALALFSTGMLLRRRNGRTALAAMVSSTLLVVDAWFDTMTAAPGSDFTIAVAMAVCAELPLAAVCATLAVRASPHPGS